MPWEPSGGLAVLSVEGAAALLRLLRGDGYTLIGPTVRDGAIVQGEIRGAEELPIGWSEVQEAGRYRLVRRDDEAWFGFSVGPRSYKELFFAPRERLFKVRRSKDGVEVHPEPVPEKKLALIGARGCDLRATEVQDRTFLGGPFVDESYATRRREVFVLAVHCGQAGGTCFCVSMSSGPKAQAGFDLALTELFEPHRFLVEVGSERGARLLERLEGLSAATEADERAAEERVAHAAGSMGRQVDTAEIKELLYRNAEHPRWDEVAERYLSCTNCTLVCPTCFCSSVEDTSDLAGEEAERWRRWDSCFTLDHSYVHGGNVRSSRASRYRQWLTHKFASWIDQFGTSGCVGCGRCITWCPVGIDVTEELSAIRATDGARRGGAA